MQNRSNNYELKLQGSLINLRSDGASNPSSFTFGGTQNQVTPNSCLDDNKCLPVPSHSSFLKSNITDSHSQITRLLNSSHPVSDICLTKKLSLAHIPNTNKPMIPLREPYPVAKMQSMPESFQQSFTKVDSNFQPLMSKPADLSFLGRPKNFREYLAFTAEKHRMIDSLRAGMVAGFVEAKIESKIDKFEHNTKNGVELITNPIKFAKNRINESINEINRDIDKGAKIGLFIAEGVRILEKPELATTEIISRRNEQLRNLIEGYTTQFKIAHKEFGTALESGNFIEAGKSYGRLMNSVIEGAAPPIKKTNKALTNPGEMMTPNYKKLLGFK